MSNNIECHQNVTILPTIGSSDTQYKYSGAMYDSSGNLVINSLRNPILDIFVKDMWI